MCRQVTKLVFEIGATLGVVEESEVVVRSDTASSSPLTDIGADRLRLYVDQAGERRATIGGIVSTIVALSMMVSLLLTGSALAAENCANATLRDETGSSELPECRAYEMATPSFHAGYPMYALSYSSDGEQAILYTLGGGLAGIEGSGEHGPDSELYLDRRTPMGWKLTPLNPPAAEFAGQVPVAQEANSGETLWEQHTLGQTIDMKDLYTRSAAGSFGLVGPLSLPSVPSIVEEEPGNALNLEETRADVVTGATSNYKHVILASRTPRAIWHEFDATEYGRSLYEYTGLNNERPTLVAVTGEKGSDELIGRCGVKPGGYGETPGSTYNAISNDGETIFFTVEPATRTCTSAPPFAEVWARRHGSPKVSERAESADVSASECTAAECKEKSGSSFAGASENGEHVFFTSTQKLTSSAADGVATGNAAARGGCAEITVPPGCNLYYYDFERPEGDRLTAVAEEVLGVVGIAEDGDRVYFVSQAALAGKAAAGQPNLYVYDVNGEIQFIATLQSGESDLWEKYYDHPAEVAGAEGQFLLFTSSTPNLTAEDTTEAQQLFEYDALEGELVRVSQGEVVRVGATEEKYNQNGNDVKAGVNGTPLTIASINLGGTEKDFQSTVNQLDISENGRTVFFESAGALSPRAESASAGCQNIYEFHTDGALREGTVHLISSGETCDDSLQFTDASGENVLFGTDASLTTNDVDGGQASIYDARVGGGFPTSPAGEGGRCDAGTCERASNGPSVLPTAASASELGEPLLIPSTNGPSSKVKAKAKSKVRRNKQRSKGKRGKGMAKVRRVMRNRGRSVSGRILNGSGRTG